jgi:hypothetical protein
MRAQLRMLVSMRGFVVAALVSITPAIAHADGEATPMIGGAVVWSPTDQRPSGMVGVALEAAWWHGRVGFAVEGSAREYVDGEHDRALTVGTSLRLRMFDSMYPSLMEPRDVEVGIELQAIAERWWERQGDDGLHYGVGLALRVRGGADDGSTRIAESRFFVRVMAAPQLADRDPTATARTTMPLPAETHELMLLLGIGASFGGGERRYVDRFRWRGPDWPVDQRGTSRPGSADSTF